MRRDSIQRRLIATVVLSQAILTVGLMVTGVLVTYWRLLATLDVGMQAHAMSVAVLVRYTEEATGNVYFDNTLLPESIDPNHPDQFKVWADRTGLLARSEDWPEGLPLLPGSNQHWNFTWAGVPYHALRITHVPILDREEGNSFRPQTLTIVYASPTIRIRQQVKAAAAFIALISLLLLGTTAGLASWGIRRGLLPLQALAQQAAGVSAQSWQLEPPKEAEEIEELRPLTEAMTQMLSRLERSFVQQREFVGNAAHELKTPLAVLKSTLQSLLQRPRSPRSIAPGCRPRCRTWTGWNVCCNGCCAWLVPNSGHRTRESRTGDIDINTTCEEAVENIRVLAETHNTTISLATNGPVPFRADPEDLHLVWTNLLENAVRYSPAGRVG